MHFVQQTPVFCLTKNCYQTVEWSSAMQKNLQKAKRVDLCELTAQADKG